MVKINLELVKSKVKIHSNSHINDELQRIKALEIIEFKETLKGLLNSLEKSMREKVEIHLNWDDP